jgi:hypothetical protein
MTLQERLLNNAKIVDGHWLWTGYTSWQGYGLISANGKNRKAHAVAYEIFIGPIPEGCRILHKPEICQKHRNCICPEHLYAGTTSQNNKDTFTTNTSKRSNLTYENVIAIRLSNRPYGEIAAKHGITPQAVGNIKSLHSWFWVQPEIKGVISPFAHKPPTQHSGRGGSKLSNDEILTIRETEGTVRNLAAQFHVSAATISNIKRRIVFSQIK